MNIPQSILWSDNLSRCLVDLKFVEKINQGEKPCFVKRIYIPSDSWFGSVYRFVYNESGRDAHQRIRSIFHDAMEYFNNIKLDEQKVVIVQQIRESVKGVQNLLITYERCPDVYTNLEVLLTEITTWIKRYDIYTPVPIPQPITNTDILN